MELEVGGIYMLERNPMKKVKLYDRKSDGGRHIYQQTMNSKILVVAKPKRSKGKRGIRYIVYFFPVKGRPEMIDCLYIEWIKRIGFLKKERDLTRWPPLAKQNFLMQKGAAPDPVQTDDIEKAQRQIAHVGRRRRMEKESYERAKERMLKSKGKPGSGETWVTVDVGSSTGYGHYSATTGTIIHSTLANDTPDDEFLELDPVDEELWEEAEAFTPRLGQTLEEKKAGYLDSYGRPRPRRAKRKRKKKKKTAPKKLSGLKTQHCKVSFGEEEPWIPVGATYTAPSPVHRTKAELRTIIDDPSHDPAMREQACHELEERERKEEEIRQAIKASNEQFKKSKSNLSFSDWYKETQKKEETE